MKTIEYTKYGPPDVLQLNEVEKPIPGDNELLIRVYATTVTAVDSTFRKGDRLSARLFTGLTKPKNPVLGGEFAGEIEAVGKNVKRFKAGDQVFGSTDAGLGAHAEYISLPEDGALALKPAAMSYEEAAASNGVLTALPFLRDGGNIQSEQKVLIIGASGSIGTFAVQLARYYGADVTGVCSTANVGLVKSLGADKVIDYTKEDFTKNGQTYDIIFDTVGKSSFARCKGSLTQNGIYLTTVLSVTILLQMLWTSLIGSKKAKIMFAGLRPAHEKIKDLTFLNKLVEAGKIKSVMDRSYLLDQISEAYRYVDKGHKKGNVVISMGRNGKS